MQKQSQQQLLQEQYLREGLDDRNNVLGSQKKNGDSARVSAFPFIAERLMLIVIGLTAGSILLTLSLVVAGVIYLSTYKAATATVAAGLEAAASASDLLNRTSRARMQGSAEENVGGNSPADEEEPRGDAGSLQAVPDAVAADAAVVADPLDEGAAAAAVPSLTQEEDQKKVKTRQIIARWREEAAAAAAGKQQETSF